MDVKGMQRMGLEAQLAQRTADVAAASSAALAGTAWIADLEPVVTVLAGVAAIFAGAFAAWYHFEKALDMRRHNREEQQARKERD